MLKRRLTGLLAVVALTLGTLLASAVPASAEDGVWYDPETGNTYLTLSSPPSDPVSNPDSNGWTAGAQSCYVEITRDLADSLGIPQEDLRVWVEGSQFYAPISCGNSTGYWSNNRQCYVHLADYPWPNRPPGYDQDAGYYKCIAPMQFGDGVVKYFWSNTVPPGLQVYTPGMAAKKLVESFQLQGIDIGMAPEINPAWGHRRSYVGVPIWLWVDNPQPLTWGPYTETATLGGQTITATAQVTSVIWNMGDGASTVCGGTGTPYNAGIGLQPSPTCGYRYATTSDRNASDRYTVTATSQWTVTWTSLAGPGGTINLTTTSADELEINELQTVIVPNDSTTDTSGGTP
ncbi:TPA: hypothetical protein PIH69_002942 [Staphylococcus aureus]|nr:hypothetical protein [Staphylococcus aureus]